jgi:site-specific DNA-cytosine methylase
LDSRGKNHLKKTRDPVPQVGCQSHPELRCNTVLVVYFSTIALTFSCSGKEGTAVTMATAPSGMRLGESLKRVYKELRIADNDIECLANDHRIRSSRDLGMKRQCLEQKELVGVSESAQNKLENVAKYVVSKGVDKCPDPLANFTRKEYYEYFVESDDDDDNDDIDLSGAAEHGGKAILGTKDEPICCDSIASEEETEGTVTFMGSSSPNPTPGRLPFEFVKIQGDLASTLGVVTSNSNTHQSQDEKPRAQNFPDDSDRRPLTESETDEDRDESDHFDLSEEEDQAAMARLRDSALYLMMQGFEHSPRMSAGVDERERDDNALEIKESYDGVDGLKLRVGNCYNYQRQEDGSQFVLGIISFRASRNEIMAKCCLVVPYSVTFFGEYGVENLFPGGVGDFFQIRKDLGLFPLSSFSGVCNDPATIPKLIYEPQTLASRHTFGYVYDNNGNNRVGRRNEMRFVELCCGAGGMHQGYKDAGFKTAMAVDNDDDAMDTFEANNPNVQVSRGDVKAFPEEYETQIDFRQRVGSYVLVHASPPCGPFSSLNRHKEGEDYLADRDLSKTTFIECIRKLDPLVVVFENVEGILHQQSNDVFTHILKELVRMDYQFRVRVLKACDFGDPQIRKRLFIIAAKPFVLLPSFPVPTHGPNLLPYVTAKNALEKLRSADPAKIPNIADCRTTTLDEGVHGVCKLEANELAPTVRAKGPAVLHYAEDRCVNVRESAALQGFPDDHKILGGLSSMYKQVGNAVPFKLAAAIARSIRDSLEYEYEEESEMTKAMCDVNASASVASTSMLT